MACNLGYTAFEERNMTNEMTEKQSITMMSRDNSVTEIYLSPRYRPEKSECSDPIIIIRKTRNYTDETFTLNS